MSLGFDNIPVGGGYLRQAGIQMAARFIALTYVANESWEGFDIELETAEGKLFRERTFGANIEKVFPKQKYQNGQAVGMETKQEAFERVQNDISKKLFYLASAFVTRNVLKEKVKNVKDLKDMVDKVNQALAEANLDQRVNFLTMWKNSDSKQRSNLILADRVQWIEATRYNGETPMNAGISLTKYQLDNNMVEKYPYNGNNESTATESALLGSQGVDDLPF
jgi:hypothetical protein